MLRSCGIDIVQHIAVYCDYVLRAETRHEHYKHDRDHVMYMHSDCSSCRSPRVNEGWIPGTEDVSQSMVNSMLTAVRTSLSAMGKRIGISRSSFIWKLLDGRHFEKS